MRTSTSLSKRSYNDFPERKHVAHQRVLEVSLALSLIALPAGISRERVPRDDDDDPETWEQDRRDARLPLSDGRTSGAGCRALSAPGGGVLIAARRRTERGRFPVT